MKKRYIVLLALVFILTLCAGLFACVGSENPSSTVPTNTVTFYENYPGGQITSVKVEEGEKVLRPQTDPSRGGYSFEGWYTAYDGGELFDFDQIITSDTQVFAAWTKTAFEVTYKYNNGQPDGKAYVSEGGTLSQPSDPVRDQYSFDNWYFDADCTQVFNGFGSAVTSDLVIYAGWLQSEATVTFNYNYTGAPENTAVPVEIGQSVSAPEAPERDMYAFVGWSVSVSGNRDNLYDFSQPVTGNLTLYAVWERSEYIVTFNPNYQDAQAIEVRVPAGEEAEDPDISRKGYEFAGWYEEAACITPADLTAVNEDITVYANWTLEEYTVSFDLNYDGATGAPVDQTVRYGQRATEPATPTRTGYQFVAWYTDQQLTNQFTFDTAIEGDLTLYARWEEEGTVTPDTVTITFMYNLDGMGVYHEAALEYRGLAQTIRPDDPELDGYYFYGWYTEAACINTYNFRQRVTEDTTLYARLLKQYTFEAEYVNLAGKAGAGSSVNVNEEGLIASSELIGTNHETPGSSYVSNGYYVSKLYYTGAFIDFEITADSAVTNAVLVLRVSSECKDIDTTFTDNQMQIIINGTYNDLGEPTSGIIRYGSIVVPSPNLNEVEDADYHKTPFQDVVVYTTLNLNAGQNVIRLRNNDNGNYGGTYTAKFPMIDCMYIYSDVELTMHEYYDIFNRVAGTNYAQTLAQAALAAYVTGKSYVAEV